METLDWQGFMAAANPRDVMQKITAYYFGVENIHVFSKTSLPAR